MDTTDSQSKFIKCDNDFLHHNDSTEIWKEADPLTLGDIANDCDVMDIKEDASIKEETNFADMPSVMCIGATSGTVIENVPTNEMWHIEIPSAPVTETRNEEQATVSECYDNELELGIKEEKEDEEPLDDSQLFYDVKDYILAEKPTASKSKRKPKSSQKSKSTKGVGQPKAKNRIQKANISMDQCDDIDEKPNTRIEEENHTGEIFDDSQLFRDVKDYVFVEKPNVSKSNRETKGITLKLKCTKSSQGNVKSWKMTGDEWGGEKLDTQIEEEYQQGETDDSQLFCDVKDYVFVDKPKPSKSNRIPKASNWKVKFKKTRQPKAKRRVRKSKISDDACHDAKMDDHEQNEKNQENETFDDSQLFHDIKPQDLVEKPQSPKPVSKAKVTNQKSKSTKSIQPKGKKRNPKGTTRSGKNTCTVCGLNCRSKKRLEIHSVTHDLTRRFKCDQCDATYKRKDHLSGHIKSKHSGIK